MNRQRPIVFAAGAALLVALIGGSMTTIGPWYRALEKSPLTPPDWLFGPAWTLIYALAAAAAVFGWRAAGDNRRRSWLLSLFFCNAVLNILWSLLFFTVKRPDWALAEVATLWLSVLALIVFHLKFSPRSSLLLAPYLAWVSFAAYLNVEIVRLNAPFAGSGG